LTAIPIVIFLHIAQNKSTLLQRVVVSASANEFLQFTLLSVSSTFLLSIAASAAAIGLVKKHNTGHDFLSGRTLKHSLLKWSVLDGIVLGVFMGSHQIDRFLLNQAYVIELNPDIVKPSTYLKIWRQTCI